MSINALKAAATGNQVAHHNEKPTTLAGLLADPKIKAQMALALPKHMTADRLARIATTEIRKVPKLASCDQASFLGAIMQCAQLGLEPGRSSWTRLPDTVRQTPESKWKMGNRIYRSTADYRLSRND